MDKFTENKRINRRIVEKASEKYKRVLSLNRNCYFYLGKDRVFVINKKVNSKSAFVSFDYSRFLALFIDRHYDEISDLLGRIYNNRREYKAYQVNVSKLARTPTSVIDRYNISYEEFYEEEDALIQEVTLPKPTFTVKVLCNISYISPKGRNSYSKHEEFIAPEIWNIWEKVTASRNDGCSDSRKRERQKMTLSLRYDILKRDQFCCQICGRTAAEGVALEIDHVVPISKGGKTEPSNLRTLCRDCNRGKRDKQE